MGCASRWVAIQMPPIATQRGQSKITPLYHHHTHITENTHTQTDSSVDIVTPPKKKIKKSKQNNIGKLGPRRGEGSDHLRKPGLLNKKNYKCITAFKMKQLEKMREQRKLAILILEGLLFDCST